MRVAVCISGALRGNLNTLNNIYTNIIKPLNADVFIHTWDSYYVWPGIGGDNNIVYRLFGPQAQSLLPVAYRTRAGFEIVFPHTMDVLKQEVIENIPLDKIRKYIDWAVIEIENEHNFINNITKYIDYKNHSINQLKMFFSMYQCYNLVKTYESNNNIMYDYIVRIRPDISIKQVIDEVFVNSIKDNELAVELYDYGPTDQFFISSNKVMEKIVSLWNEIIKSKSLSPFVNYKEIRSHYLLLFWIIKNNIVIKNMKINRYVYSATCNTIPDISNALELDINNCSIKKELYEFYDYLLKKSYKTQSSEV